MTFKSFIELLMDDEIELRQIDDWVDGWHSSHTFQIAKQMSLRDYIGLTPEEYVRWMQLGDEELCEIAGYRKNIMEEQKMIIERVSPVSGKLNSMELPITVEQFERWQNGEVIQLVMPHLTPGQREFLITGTTEEDWDSMFGDGDDE